MLLTALAVPSVSVSRWCRSNQTVCNKNQNTRATREFTSTPACLPLCQYHHSQQLWGWNILSLTQTNKHTHTYTSKQIHTHKQTNTCTNTHTRTGCCITKMSWRVRLVNFHKCKYGIWHCTWFKPTPHWSRHALNVRALVMYNIYMPAFYNATVELNKSVRKTKENIQWLWISVKCRICK